MSRLLRIFFIISLVMSLTACGFHLRNQNYLPPQLRVLYIESGNPYSQFITTLKQTLRASGAHIVQSRKLAPVTLQIISTSLTHSNPTLGLSNQAQVYAFTYIVEFQLITTKGALIIGPLSVGTSQNLIVNAGQVLGSNNQVDLLEEEMEHEVSNQILNRLSAQQVRDALNKFSSKKNSQQKKI